MAKKRKYARHGLPLILLLGIIVMVIFYFLYGAMMFLRYILGALMFATVTVTLIKYLNKKAGKRRVVIK